MLIRAVIGGYRAMYQVGLGDQEAGSGEGASELGDRDVSSGGFALESGVARSIPHLTFLMRLL